MSQEVFIKLQRAISDALTPISEHPAEVGRVRMMIELLHTKCPSLEIYCVVNEIAVIGAGTSNADLVGELTSAERSELQDFIKAKLVGAEAAVE